VVQTPAGELIDRTKRKRECVVFAAVLVAVTSISMVVLPYFPAVAASRFFQGIGCAIVPPAIGSLTLGIVRPDVFVQQVSSNEMFNNAGTLFCALSAGLLAYFVSPQTIFFVVAATAVASAACCLAIPAASIDHERARGKASKVDEESGEEASEHTTGGYCELLKSKSILVFSISAGLFHFANAAVLPLLGQLLAIGPGRAGIPFTAACIIVGRFTAIAVASICGKFSDTRQKQLMLIGFGSLPVRTLLIVVLSHAVSDSSARSACLIATQILDGVGAGVWGVMSYVVTEDMTKGSGHFSLALGWMNMCQQLGASFSTLMAEWVVDEFGFDAGFLTCGALGLLPILIYGLFMPAQRAYDLGHNTPLVLDSKVGYTGTAA